MNRAEFKKSCKVVNQLVLTVPVSPLLLVCYPPMSSAAYLTIPPSGTNIAHVDGRFSLKEILGAGSHGAYRDTESDCTQIQTYHP